MAKSEEDVKILVNFGLTLSQARVYLALCELKKAKVRDIWKVSAVARQDIYRLLSDLQQIGLAEKLLTAPAQYRALPIRDASKILLQRKKDEIAELERRIDRLTEKYQYRDRLKEATNKEYNFVMIPEKETLGLRKNQSIDRTQRSIEILSSVKRLSSSLSKYNYVDCLEKGVQIRVISEFPNEKNYYQKIVPALTRKPNFKLRFIPEPPPTVFACYDEKEVYISTDPKAGLEDVPMIWSNYPTIVNLIKDYFENQWSTAAEHRIR